MTRQRGEVLLSPCWRTRRRAASEWIEEHPAAVQDGRALIWVEDRLLARWLHFELAERHGVLFPPPVRLAAEVGRDILLRAGRVAAQPRDDEMLAYVAAALAGGAPGLDRYARFADRPATCRTLADTLALLRAEDPDPARWRDNWAAAVPYRAADLDALSALETAVAEQLERHHKTLGSRLNLEAAERVEPGCLGEVRHLLVYDAVGLDASERALLAAVLERAGLESATAVLPGEPGPQRDPFVAAAPGLDVCLNAGLRLRHLPATASSSATALFRPGAGKGHAVYRRITVATPYRGLTETFRRIKRLLLDDPDLPPHEIVVVMPGLEAFADAARSLAERYGVGVAVAAPARRDLTGVGAAAVALLEAVAGPFPRRAMIDLLASAPVRSGLPADSVAALDEVSRAAGIVDGPWAVWRREIEQLGRVREFYDGPPNERIEQALRSVDELTGIFGETGPASAAEHGRRLGGWLRWFGFQRDDDESDGEIDPLARLAALDGWPANRPLQTAEYARLARELLQAAEQADAPRPGQVLITTPGRLCGAAPRHIFLLNAVSGTYPAPARAAIPLDALDLERMGLGGSRSASRQGWARAALGFLDIVTAGESLTVVEPLSDAGGEEAIRSPLLDDLDAVCAVRDPLRVRAEERLPPPDKALAPAELVASLVAAEQAALGDHAPSARPFERPRWEALAEALEAARIEVGRAAGQALAQRYDGVLIDTAAAAAAACQFGEEQPFSATRLETYHAWPFGFFLSYCLGIEEADEPTGAVDALTEGTLIHVILREVLASHELPATEAEARDRVATAVGRLLPDEMRMPGVSLGMWRRVRAQIADYCRGVLLQDGVTGRLNSSWPAGRRPRWLEQRFGMGADAWPPLRVVASGTTVMVRGVIDRVDETPDGYILIDYKRTVRGPAKGLGRDRPYQLPLYALAVLQHHPGARILGWAYLDCRRPERSGGHRMPPDLIAKTIAAVEQQVVEDARRIRNGQYPVAPPPKPASGWGGGASWALLGLARVVDRLGGEEADDE